MAALTLYSATMAVAPVADVDTFLFRFLLVMLGRLNLGTLSNCGAIFLFLLALVASSSGTTDFLLLLMRRSSSSLLGRSLFVPAVNCYVYTY